MSYKKIERIIDNEGKEFYRIDGTIFEPPAKTPFCVNEFNFKNNCAHLRAGRMIPKQLKKTAIGTLKVIDTN